MQASGVSSGEVCIQHPYQPPGSWGWCVVVQSIHRMEYNASMVLGEVVLLLSKKCTEKNNKATNTFACDQNATVVGPREANWLSRWAQKTDTVRKVGQSCCHVRCHNLCMSCAGRGVAARERTRSLQGIVLGIGDFRV